MLVLILPTPGGWKAEWTLAGKKVTKIFNHRPGRGSNRGPQDWEVKIFTTVPPQPLLLNVLSFTISKNPKMQRLLWQILKVVMDGSPNIFIDDGWATKHTNKVCARICIIHTFKKTGTLQFSNRRADQNPFSLNKKFCVDLMWYLSVKYCIALLVDCFYLAVPILLFPNMLLT